jgi:hypothetical protein
MQAEAWHSGAEEDVEEEGGGGRTIIGGFILSTTETVFPPEGACERSGSSSMTDEIADSIDRLLSELDVRGRPPKVPAESRNTLGTGVGNGDYNGRLCCLACRC